MKAEWRTAPFDAVVADESGGNTKTPQGEFLPKGRFPIVDQGKALIAGYSDDPTRVCKSTLPVIVFGDHTRCFKFVDFPFCMGADGVKVLRPRTEMNAKYLFHYLRTLRLPEGGYDRHFKYLKRIQVALPPLPEQQRIVAILDLAETLRSKRRHTLARLDTLVAEVFWHLFGRHAGPASVHVAPGEPVAPRGWRWAKLMDVARLATGHTPDRKRADYWGGDVPWITLSDIRQLDGTVAMTTMESVTEKGIENSSAVKLPPGTVCLSRTASVGFVTVMGKEMSTSQDFVNWVCGPDLDPTYLMRALIDSRRTLLSLATGSTHRTIYFPTVEQFRVLVPPLPLQREFAAQVAAVDRLKSSHRASLAKLDELFAALQHRAFRGEL